MFPLFFLKKSLIFCRFSALLLFFFTGSLFASDSSSLFFSDPGQKEGIIIDKTRLQAKADSLYFQAENALFYDKRADALKLYRKALLFQGESSWLRGKLAEIYILEGLYSQAFFQYRILLKKDPKNSDMRFYLTKLYKERELYDEALNECQVLLKQQPENFEFGFEKALILKKQGLHSKSIAQINKMLSTAGRTEKIQLYLQKAHIYKLLQKIPLQKKALNKAIALNPVKEKFINLIMGHYVSMGDIKGARDYLLGYQERHKNSIHAAKILSEVFFSLNNKKSLYNQLKKLQSFGALDNFEAFQLAVLLVEKKKYDLAGSFFMDLLRDKQFTSSAYYFLGFIHERKQNLSQAEKYYRKVHLSDEYFFKARARLAWLLKEEKKWTEALAIMKNLHSQFQKTPKSFFTYARFLKEGNQLREALEVLSQAETLFPEQLNILFLKGFYLGEAGQISESVEIMKKILKINPRYVRALNFLAYTYSENKGPLKTAEKMAKKALLLSPKSGYILDTLGWILYKKGQWQEALLHLKQAFQVSQEESIIAEHLGEVYQKLKKFKKSAFYFKKAMELEKDNSKRKSLEKRMALVQARL